MKRHIKHERGCGALLYKYVTCREEIPKKAFGPTALLKLESLKNQESNILPTGLDSVTSQDANAISRLNLQHLIAKCLPEARSAGIE